MATYEQPLPQSSLSSAYNQLNLSSATLQDLEDQTSKRFRSIASIGGSAWKMYTSTQASTAEQLLSAKNTAGLNLFSISDEYSKMNWFDRMFTPANKRVSYTGADLAGSSFGSEKEINEFLSTGFSPTKLIGKGIGKGKDLWSEFSDFAGQGRKPIGSATPSLSNWAAGISTLIDVSKAGSARGRGHALLRGAGKGLLSAYAPGLSAAWSLYDMFKK